MNPVLEFKIKLFNDFFMVLRVFGYNSACSYYCHPISLIAILIKVKLSYSLTFISEKRFRLHDGFDSYIL